MKQNLKFIIFIIIAIIALYFTRVNYGEHSKNKSILACVIAQKNKSTDMTSEEAEKLGTDKSEVGVVAYSIRD